MTEYSQNGWVASATPSSIGVVAFTPVPGHTFPAGVKAGDVAWMLGYVAKQFHTHVEPLGTGCWGYSYRPNRNDPSSLSNHSSGTAIDINAPKHPNGERGTFSAAQVSAIHGILAHTGGCVRWGGDYHTTADEMHFEINVNAATLHAQVTRMKAAAPVPSWYHRQLFVTTPMMTGPDVHALQTFLKAVASSKYDVLTRDNHVIPWQRQHGVLANGIFGLQSAQAAYRLGSR